MLWTLQSPSVQAEDIKVKYKADRIKFTKNKDIFRLIGNVDLKVRDVTLTSEEVTYDTKNKVLSSHVPFTMIQKDKKGVERTIKGKKFTYYVNLKRIEAEEVFLLIPAQTKGQFTYVRGERMVAYNDGQRVVMRDGFYTTCNSFEKRELTSENWRAYLKHGIHYSVSATIMDLVQDDRVLAWNARFESYENQLFWFPFWIIPLREQQGLSRPDVDFGQNQVEGYYVRFKNYYKWNDYHDGRWYVTVMEKKGVGLGFQHDWIAAPNSITRFYFYGLPVTSELLQVPQAFFTGPTSEAEDQVNAFQSAQLVTTPTATAPASDETIFGAINKWFSNKFTDRDIQIHHKQRLLPHTELDFTYKDTDLYSPAIIGATKNVNRSFDWKVTDNQIINLDRETKMTVDSQLTMRQGVNNPTTRNFSPDQTTRFETTTIGEQQNRTAKTTIKIGKGSLSLNSNWRKNLNSQERKEFDVDSLVPKVQTSTAPTGQEIWQNTMNYNVALTPKTNFKASTSYNSNVNGISATNPGTLQQQLIPRLDLTHQFDWANLTATYNDFFDFSPNPRPANQVKKLPEISMTFNPLFKENFPIQFKTIQGRYFDPQSADDLRNLIGTNLLEIGRSVYQLNLVSKVHDVGMGMKLNFQGTEFQQRFYQTQDSEYIFKGQVNLKNDYSKYFVPSFTYRRAIQDDQNNSPFKSLQPLRLTEFKDLTASLGLVNLPEFTMTVNSRYDYRVRQYGAIQGRINSKIGDNFTFTAQSGYQPQNIQDKDVGKELPHISNTGPCKNPDGQTLTVKPEDVGSFTPYCGKWLATTLGYRWRSSADLFATGHLVTFGLDSGIPQGVELGSSIGFDFDTGRINALNNMLRFSVGDSWPWHTEFDLIMSVQPTLFPESFEELGNLEIPFKLTIRKDLHDFLLTLSWDSFLQQFNINLSMIAFPFSTSDIVSNVDKLGNQAQSGLNSATGQR